MSDQVLEAVQKLAGNIENKSAATAKEIAEAKSAFEKAAAEAGQKIAELNEDLSKKGATIGQMQEEIKALKAKRTSMNGAFNEMPSVFSEVKQAIADNADNFAAVEKGERFKQIEMKAVANISSGNLTATNYLTYLGWQEGMEPLGQNRFRSLVRTVQSDTDFVRYPRANSPIGEGSFTRQASEGAAKSQIDRDYTMIDLTLKAMSGYAIVSRQSLRNISFLQSWLPTSMLEQLQDNEDIDFTNTLYAAATGSLSASGSKPMTRIVDYILNLQAAKFSPNAIAVSKQVLSGILLNTESSAGFNIPNVITIDASGTVKVLGVPVVQWNQLTANQVIVGDFRKASIVQSEGLTVRQTDSHASTFTTNEVTFLLERTEGLAIHRPDAFIAVNIA